MTVHNHLKSIAPDLPESPAAVALAELQKLAVGTCRRTGRNWRMLWGQPTAFQHVSKDLILEAVGGFASDEVSRLEKLKKKGASQ